MVSIKLLQLRENQPQYLNVQSHQVIGIPMVHVEVLFTRHTVVTRQIVALSLWKVTLCRPMDFQSGDTTIFGSRQLAIL